MTEPDIKPTPTPTVQYQHIHGYKRAFIYTGRGPVLLLIHGIGDSSETWRDVIPLLAQRYTVLAPDLLGHGSSDKPRADYSVAGYANGMRDLLGVLGIDRATVVGHSLGGGVAMQFVYQFPEMCERLVLVASGGVCADVNPLLRLAAAPNAELVLPFVALSATRTLTHWLCKLMRRFDADIGVDADDLMRVLNTLPNLSARRAFLRTLRSVVDWRGQAITMLDRCYLTGRVPVLLVWGSRDAVIPARHGAIANLAMPGSRLEIFEGAGHFPFRTDPTRFVSLLECFHTSSNPSPYDVDAWRVKVRRGPPGRHLAVKPSELKCIRADSCGAWCQQLPCTGS
ncbi:MAG: alpha/beta hydrolase [Polyangiales bacterium]